MDTQKQKAGKKLSQRALAELLGVSHSLLRKYFDQGCPPDSDAARVWIADNITPSVEADSDETLMGLRRQHEKLKIQAAELSLQERRGDLVERSRVRSFLVNLATFQKETFLVWVSRVAPLVAERDIRQVNAVLDREMRELLLEIAEVPHADLERI